ncbi:hypothetical protein [Paenibacillus tyrfis]|uniref:Butirosin biosynthesis protein H N-terminal domain-containing protein n=1 Tax=Paenibacillus tyrfis TaxID=1501230 RepID=A0A081NTP2_9BACL|nr:hypothetical protein [Paenibacillus tyrfis]KEQ21815.1 hypothetical protein ET33_30880 [Paenibacillus tyrfis]
MNKEIEAWLYSNYIQLYAHSDLSGENINDFVGGWLDFYTSHQAYFITPLIRTQRLLRETVGFNRHDCLEFICSMIDRGFYVWLFVDKFYISKAWAFQKQTHLHSILLFGYDKSEGIFNAAGFFDSEGFKTIKVLNSELIQALFSPKLIESFSVFDYMEYIFMYQFNPKGKFYFDINCVKDIIGDYYLSRNTSEKFYMNRNILNGSYGLNIYTALKEFVEYRALIKNIDIRPFHVLYDHKKIMVSRINYMEQNEYIKDSLKLYEMYSLIERKALTLRNLVIKHNLSKETDYTKKIFLLIDDLAAFELSTLDFMLSKL